MSSISYRKTVFLVPKKLRSILPKPTLRLTICATKTVATSVLCSCISAPPRSPGVIHTTITPVATYEKDTKRRNTKRVNSKASTIYLTAENSGMDYCFERSTQGKKSKDKNEKHSRKTMPLGVKNIEITRYKQPPQTLKNGLKTQPVRNTKGDAFGLGIIDLRPDSNYRDQLEFIKSHLLKISEIHETGVIFVVFSHGWSHDSHVCDNHVRNFRKALDDIKSLENTRAKFRQDTNPRKVIGLYIAWDGRQFSFWNARRSARVAGKMFSEILKQGSHIKKYLEEIKESSKTRARGKPPSISIFIGQSLGANVVLNPIKDNLRRLFRNKASASSHWENRVTDLTLLINPALDRSDFSGTLYKNTDLGREKGKYPARIIIYQSKGDMATRILYPLAMYKKSIGHDRLLRSKTHRTDSVNPDDPCRSTDGENKLDTPTDRFAYYYLWRKGRRKRQWAKAPQLIPRVKDSVKQKFDFERNYARVECSEFKAQGERPVRLIRDGGDTLVYRHKDIFNSNMLLFVWDVVEKLIKEFDAKTVPFRSETSNQTRK